MMSLAIQIVPVHLLHVNVDLTSKKPILRPFRITEKEIAECWPELDCLAVIVHSIRQRSCGVRQCSVSDTGLSGRDGLDCHSVPTLELRFEEATAHLFLEHMCCK